MSDTSFNDDDFRPEHSWIKHMRPRARLLSVAPSPRRRNVVPHLRLVGTEAGTPQASESAAADMSWQRHAFELLLLLAVGTLAVVAGLVATLWAARAIMNASQAEVVILAVVTTGFALQSRRR